MKHLKINFLMRIGILWLTTCCSFSVFAQTEDSVTTVHSALLNDSMFQIIDDMHERSAKMEAINRRGFNLESIDSNLPGIVETVETVDMTLQHGAQFLDMKALHTFKLLVDQAKSQFDIWRKQLLSYTQQISAAQEDIQRMRDIPLLEADSSNLFFVELYKAELVSLDSTFQQLKVSNDNYSQEIQKLQVLVSRNFYKTNDLQRDLEERIKNYSIRTLGKESNYLWEKPVANSQEVDAINFGKIALAIDQHIILSYFLDNFERHLIIALVLFVLYIIWVRRNYKAIAGLENSSSILKDLHAPDTVSNLPLLSGFILIFNVWLLFDLDAPEAYVAFTQFILFIATAVFVFKNGTKNERKIWLGLLLVYLLFLVFGASYNPNHTTRFLFLAINLYLIFSSLLLLKQNKPNVKIQRSVRWLLYAIMAMNAGAFLLNCAGRVTLSKALTNAGLIGFVQVIALSIFKDIMITAIQLKTIVYSLKEKQRSFLNMHAMSNQLLKLLSVLTLFLFFAVFAVNLNFFSSFQKGVSEFLFGQRTIGSTTFTIGNIALFFLVIYLSNLAQRYVGYFFGEGSGDSIPEGKRGSKLVIWKLVIIVVGFMLAIIVSGLPLDRVTIVLSAFGVGIGLGLQNVVNNFVSGLILIFERPLQVGDYVEVGGLKGWVKDIGIRATRMESNDGAEIIVPNGSILAGNLTNWTLSSSKVRVEMQVKIAPLSQLALAKDIIRKEILKYNHTVTSRPPEILQTGLSNAAADLKISFWIDHINRREIAKSAVLNDLYERFAENDISMS